MENPGRILRRAQLNKRRQAVQAKPAENLPPRLPAWQIPSGHANYTALMRSHDRMNSRHIAARPDA